MSLWAYVNGMCTVMCPGSTQADIDSNMQQAVSELPAVFGSEGNAVWQVVNTNKIDCVRYSQGTRCELRHTFIVAVHSSLRDTTADKAYKQVCDAVKALARQVMMKYCNIEVCGYPDKTYCLHQPYSILFDHHSLLGKYFKSELDEE